MPAPDASLASPAGLRSIAVGNDAMSMNAPGRRDGV
jgi:hypothetical protein